VPKQKWESKYLTGIEQIDQDHEGLLKLIDRIRDMFVQGNYADKDYLDVLESLSDYVARHFAYEERWMAEHHYPGLAEHRLDHQRFSSKVSDSLHRFKNGTGHLTLDLLTFLKIWLVTHITVLDADLGAFDRMKRGQSRANGG